ncbi:hypothetical protein THRCLA_20949 [Thraustotheca clavata]|uniref:Uncharacterized protein n=1 Tax=Thraustotheca clavata TaxID=74557 RepID=A0A1W0A1K6_9STRA|nr:hypothetical protein THRCLA_20949 [Thraustotheca clavata]
MGKKLMDIVSISIAFLTIVQGLGIAIVAGANALISLFLGMNVLLCGVCLLFYEVNPLLAPFDMRRWLRFLDNLLGKAYLYQFLACLCFESNFGAIWNTFIFWYFVIASGICFYGYSTSSEKPEQNQDSLLMHDYQTLDVQAI